MTTRILLVDDSAEWRVFARSILEGVSGFRVISEANDGLEVVKKAAKLLPDIVLLDIGMPLLNGIEAAKRIRQVCPDSKIIFLTQENDCDIRNEALATGAEAYLVKSAAALELHSTIEKAMLRRFENLSSERLALFEEP